MRKKDILLLHAERVGEQSMTCRILTNGDDAI